MQVKFEVLKKDDSVLNVWDNNIAIKRKNGDVEILHYDNVLETAQKADQCLLNPAGSCKRYEPHPLSIPM